MTIELGAIISRNSDIYLNEFWNSLPEVSESRKRDFINFVENQYQVVDDDQTLWEKKDIPRKIYLSELNDLEL